MLFITSGAVDRPVAEATVGWMLALSHHMLAKDRLVRESRWDERSKYMGTELRNRTLGVIGFGGIGASLIGLLNGFGMNRPLVYDPYVEPARIAECGTEQVDLDTLLAQSDLVSLHCPLNAETTNLISERELSLMKPTAYLINTARGGIVDEAALHAALVGRRIAGAAIDCFVGEPITGQNRFSELENVLLAPHCIAWTAELFRDIGQKACEGMLRLAQGQAPAGGVVNPEVLDRRSFQQKWQKLRLE
jgi:phosphoglycerate dehydrogenase-like enzyme